MVTPNWLGGIDAANNTTTKTFRNKFVLSVDRGAKIDAEQAKAEEDVAEKIGLLRVEGIVCEARIVARPPAEAIIETAREVGADLVVIGNDQRKGLARKLAGQITDKVAGGLACSVLVVKRPSEPDDLVAAVRNQA